MVFNNIPLELRTYEQWCCWRYEESDGGKPTKVPYSPRTNRLASVSDPSTWSTFEECVNAMQFGIYDGIGFILSKNDPYTFIDLDDTKGNQQDYERQLKLYNETKSYAELSPSGSGLHIIVKGSVPSGRKRSHIEVYSDLRFMTMTGNVYRNAPIYDENDLVNTLYQQMGESRNVAAFYAGLAEAKLTDEEVIALAQNASNGHLFCDLFFTGDWQKYYPSQSEADFALFDIIAFYSQNGQQTQRIFLRSKLAEREKSRAQYRINYMLARCFDNMLPPVDIDGLRNQLNEILAKNIEAPAPQPMPQIEQSLIPETNSIYKVPPGLVGKIAQFIYAQAPRPVAEIALAGAIGLMAGIVGRAYNVSGTGLNQYMLLLAPTGTGKEAIASGIDKLMNYVVKSVPAATEFMGPSKINSEQALLKYLNKSAISFVSVIGEFGIRIREMSSPNAAPHMANLLALFLDLYNKSGEGKILRPSIYSDREKNTGDVLAPAFSIVGESTPEKFYEILNESMIESGMMPRINVIEYLGARPELNENHSFAQPSFDLVQDLSTLCAHCLMLNSQHKAIHVEFTKDAKDLFDRFNIHCDNNINSSDREVRRHLWNRAHINSMKMAALIAVGCNPYNPTIDVETANWAIDLIVSNVRNMLKRFDAGEIGIDNDETKQLIKVSEYIKDFVIKPWSELEKYAQGFSHLHNEKVIPYSYLQRRLVAVAVFRKDRMGSTNAIKRALKTLVERGDLQEVGRATMTKQFNSTAVAYMISNTKAFEL